MSARLFSRPLARGAAVILAFTAGAGLYWFQPWKLVTDHAVNETLSAVQATPSAAAPPETLSAVRATPSAAAPPETLSAVRAAPSAAAPPEAPPPGPAVVRQGGFISHEHDTSG